MQQALEDPLNVPIDDCHRLAEGDAGNGGCRVPSDAGQRAQLLGGRGKLAGVLAYNFLGGRMQHSGPAVIAQPAPCR